VKAFDVAIIGCGGISSMHLAGYAEHPERVNIAATCDVIVERARKAKDKCGAAAAFASVEQAIEGADWEVAVVCTPTPVREEVVGPLAAAGKHIFIEKPMADSIDEARRMVELTRAAGVKLAVDQTYRYYYGFDIARGLIAAGRIGKVLNIDHCNLMFRQDSGWRLDCERHAIAVLGVHWLDGFRWLLADAAKTVRAAMHRSPAIDCTGETDANVLIDFAGGASVSYVQSFSCPAGRTETAIVGETGVLVLNAGVELFDKNGGGRPVETWDNPFAASGKSKTAFKLLNELLTAIEEGGEPANGCADNLKTISLMEAVYRSAECGQAVELTEGLIA